MRKEHGALFFLEARIVGCDTLILAEPNPYERLDILFVPLGFDALAHVSRKTCREIVAFLEGVEGHHRQPPRQGSGVIDDRYAVRVVPWAGKLQRRQHEIPTDQEERAGVAEFHGCHLAVPGERGEGSVPSHADY